VKGSGNTDTLDCKLKERNREKEGERKDE